MRHTKQSSTQSALRWLRALAAGAVLLVPAGAEASAGDRPESVSHKSLSSGSSSGGSSASSSSGGSSRGSSSGGGKVGSISSSGGRGGSSSSSSSSSAGKVQSIRGHQSSSGGGGGSSSGGSGSGHGGGYHGGHHGGHHHGGHHGRGSSLYFGFGYPYYYGYWPYFYPYYPYSYHSAYRRPYYLQEEALGALDLDVKPKDTQVFVNGRFVGTAGQLDGIPRYLWLETGTYEVILYKPGYETVVREYEIHPELVIDVKLRMVSGEALPPEQLSRRLDDPAPPKTEVEVEQAWREPSAYEPTPRREGSEVVDVRQKPATVLLSVEPADASVYLDGRLVGSSRELKAGLLVEPGTHQIEIVHPSFLTREINFDARAEENVRFDVRLEPQSG